MKLRQLINLIEANNNSEVTIGDYTTTHFYMCGSAIETAKKHKDKPGMEDLIRLQDMVYKLEKEVMDAGESTTEAKQFIKKLHDAVMDQAKKIGIEDEVVDYQEDHRDSILKGDPKPGFGRVDIEENWEITDEGTRCWKGYERKGMKTMFGKRVPNCVKREHVDYCVNCGDLVFSEEMDLHEDLKKWFKQKWVRFGPDGKIRGSCGGKSEGEGKPKCLPASKAYAMGKKKRKTSAARKRRKDPNADRRGKAKNVKT